MDGDKRKGRKVGELQEETGHHRVPIPIVRSRIRSLGLRDRECLL
jgi:hypothetical protein